MLQVLQELTTGETVLREVPAPGVPRGGLLVATRRSLISAGTERMLVDFGRAGWLEKARQQPEKVRQVIDKARTDGLLQTLEAVQSKLDQPLPLGYSNVGTVLAAGTDTRGFQIGDRVATNGAHAEIVAVPQHLCARVPDSVTDDQAVFTVLGAIALQGVRLAGPTLGESFVVLGLGLIGLVAVELLRANGCRVLGIDPDPRKVGLAARMGADTATVDSAGVTDVISSALEFSRGRGVDGVLITASTKSSEPVAQAARMCRKRGRIVLVGVTGLELNRSDFYEKELTFQVSCSYGPGRYDPGYEVTGNDYPFGYVRWTEQRNFEAFLDLVAAKAIRPEVLISHRFAFSDAPAAYELLAAAREPYLGIVLNYDAKLANAGLVGRSVELSQRAAQPAPDPTHVSLAFIGAGNYGGRVLIPAFAATGVRLRGIASRGGVTAEHWARKYGIETATTDAAALIRSAAISTVVVCTRHDSHASYVCDSLAAGKNVFVEKPLALTHDELDRIEGALRDAESLAAPPLLMVGFNRRFAPQVRDVKRLLDGAREPKSITMLVNAGSLPPSHWTLDPAVGGGRIVGEACHFVDLTRFLVGHPIATHDVRVLRSRTSTNSTDDTAVITLTFVDGSIGTIQYYANGHRAYPKERLDVFCGGRILSLDNYRVLKAYGWGRFRGGRLWRQDKGQAGAANAFVEALQVGGPSPIPVEELIEVSRVVIDIGEEARC